MTFNAHRLASKAYEIGGSAAQSAFVTLIFHAYGEDDLDINDAQVLADAAERSSVMSKAEVSVSRNPPFHFLWRGAVYQSDLEGSLRLT